MKPLQKGSHMKSQTVVPTFAEFYPRYMKAYARGEKENKPSTLEAKVSIFKRSLLPYFGALPLDEIHEEIIMDYKAEMKELGLAAKTRNNCLTVLRNVFKAALVMRKIDRPPYIEQVSIKKDRNGVKGTDRIPEEDLAQVISVIKEANPWVGAFCHLLLETGLRAGELRALTWDKVTYSPDAPGYGELTIDETTAGHKYALGTTKGAPRVVPISATALGLIQSLDRIDKFLFPNRLTPERPCSLGIVCETLRKLRQQGHLRYRVHPHLFRHTYASRLRDAGVGLGDIQLLLGHVDVRTTDRYAHRNLKKLHDAIALVDASKTNSQTKSST
jgi:integrase